MIYTQNGTFLPVVLESRIINVRPNHVCTTAKEVPICCLDENGNSMPIFQRMPYYIG